MKSLRLKLLSILALAVAFAISLGLYVGVLCAGADRSVTISGSSIFYTTGGAQVWSHEVAGEEENSYYTMFVVSSDSDAVNYRRNLAYNWFYDVNTVNGVDTSEDAEVLPLEKREGYLNMEIGFELTDGKLGFEKYVLTFEGQEFSQTKNGKCINYIIFYPTENGTGLNVIVTDDIDASLPANPVTLGYDNLTIALSAGEAGGEYRVSVSDGENFVDGKFVNVGKTYAKYSSSSTTPVTPITFKAEFGEEEGAKEAKLVLYNLNGQSFKLRNKPAESDGHFASGAINDTTVPVLCLDKGVSFIKLGGEISFNYTVIDVLAQSPSLETSYFMLTKTQAADNNFNSEDYSNKNLFRKVTDSDDQKMIPHVEHYLPVEGNFGANNKFGEDLEVNAVVKVCLKLTDTSNSGVSTYVMLDWFVDEDYLVSVNGNSYIPVANDTKGVSYTYTDDENKTSDTNAAAWQQALDEYQAAVDEAAKDLLAGSKNYFYLPSAEKLFSDNATNYADMTFDIYYNNGSQKTQTNKNANALSINIDKPGRYVFTVFAKDAASNTKMYYYDSDKELKEFQTSEIWSMYAEDEDTDYAGTRKYLPWFYFDVEASEISIDIPEEQNIAYVGNEYTPDKFEINGVSYSTSYNLYLFNNDVYAAEHDGKALTYEKFMELKDELLNDATNRKYFTYIYASSELSEGTDEYEKYNDYAWNNSSPKFVPQDENAFYLIECKVKSTAGGTQSATAYMGIAAAPQVKPIKGEDTWVQDNMISIILLSIAGVSLIGIVLLLVIKPKEKGDLDEMEAAPVKKSSKK